jgi:hypothetical protein
MFFWIWMIGVAGKWESCHEKGRHWVRQGIRMFISGMQCENQSECRTVLWGTCTEGMFWLSAFGSFCIRHNLFSASYWPVELSRHSCSWHICFFYLIKRMSINSWPFLQLEPSSRQHYKCRFSITLVQVFASNGLLSCRALLLRDDMYVWRVTW